MEAVREVYVLGARSALSLIENEATAKDWDAPSILPGMTVGALAGHLARSILQPASFLAGDRAEDRTLISGSQYYAQLRDTTTRSSPLNVGVEKRAAETAAVGHAALVLETKKVLGGLLETLKSESRDRRIVVAHRPDQALLIDDYLWTRLVEFAVHIEDLALSLGIDHPAPPTVVSKAVDLLFAAARERNGDLSVLHALARRERDVHDAVRVL